MHDGQIYFGKCKREINFSLFAQSRASKISDCRREIKELTEGMCNVTYHIVFDDDSESILKIAAEDTTGNTSNEINLMKAEVSVMRLVSENCSFKVADIQYYDCSKDEKRYNSLFDFAKTMLTNLISDAQKKSIDIGCDVQRLVEQLDSEKNIFDSVELATLVHWDMWEGNGCSDWYNRYSGCSTWNVIRLNLNDV